MASSRRVAPLRRTVALLAAAGLALGGLAACGGDDASDTSGAASDELQGLVREDPIQVGDVTVPEVAVDGSSEPFRFVADPGELLFVYFGYTNCPDLCPTTLSDLRKALVLLGDDGDAVEASFMTVDPARDTPEVIVPYLASFVTGGHPLRTEDPAVLKEAQNAFGASSTVQEVDGEVKVSHTAASYIVDADGTVLVEWAFGVKPEAMASDLRILLDRQEATTSSTPDP